MITSKASKRLSSKLKREVEDEIKEIKALIAQAKADLARAQALLAQLPTSERKKQ